MKRSEARSGGQAGFAVLLVFAMSAAIAILIYMEMPRVAFEAQRTKEELLVDRGHEYQRAIQLYVRKQRKFPQSLEDLEKGNNLRYLRKRYKDPMTGNDEWRLIHYGPMGELTDSKVQKPKKGGLGEKEGYQNNFITETASVGGSTAGAPTAATLATRQRQSDLAGAPGQSGQEMPGPGGPPPPPGSQYGGSQPGWRGTGDVAQGGNVPGSQLPPISYDQILQEQQRQQQQQQQQQGYQPGRNPYAQGQGQAPGLPPGIPGTPGYNPVQRLIGQPGGLPQATGVANSQTGGVSAQPYYGLGGQPAPIQPQPAPGQFNQGNQTQGFGGQNFGGQQPNTEALRSIQNALTNTRNPQQMMGGGAAGLGPGIAGVATKFEAQGIKLINERSRYDEWEFIYDPKKDTSIAGPGAAAMQGNQNANPLGGSTNPGFNPMGGGSSGSSPLSPVSPNRNQ